MKNLEETLILALDAFWTKVEELHPERETGDLDPTTAYDLENYARNAVEAWLVLNKPTFYVQRTKTQVLRITGEDTPEEAADKAAGIPDIVWLTHSLDTEREYIVLDVSGNVLT